jgi:1-deoxy-D-xylulose-5-phosphate synthase
VVTIEENTALGGVGAAVLEALSDMAIASPVMHLGVPDCFVTHGAMDRLLSDVGLTPSAVRDAVIGRLDALEPAPSQRDAAPQSRRRPR